MAKEMREVTTKATSDDVRDISLAVSCYADTLEKEVKKLRDLGLHIAAQDVDGKVQRLREVIAPQFGAQLALFPIEMVAKIEMVGSKGGKGGD